MKKKKIIRIISIMAIMLLAVIIGIISFMNTPAQRAQRQLRLAQKYLADMDYEQAIAAYNLAIEIEPKNADAYLGLAEVYIAQGDSDMALEILRQGYELTQDEEIGAMIQSIKTLKPADYLGMTIAEIAALWGEDYLCSEDCFEGYARPIYYQDGRVPYFFYYDDIYYTANPQGNEKIKIIEYAPQENNGIDEIIEGIPAYATYTQLKELGYGGDLYDRFGEKGDINDTAFYSISYNSDISITYYWFDRDDPISTPAGDIFIWLHDTSDSATVEDSEENTLEIMSDDELTEEENILLQFINGQRDAIVESRYQDSTDSSLVNYQGEFDLDKYAIDGKISYQTIKTKSEWSEFFDASQEEVYYAQIETITGNEVWVLKFQNLGIYCMGDDSYYFFVFVVDDGQLKLTYGSGSAARDSTQINENFILNGVSSYGAGETKEWSGYIDGTGHYQAIYNLEILEDQWVNCAPAYQQTHFSDVSWSEGSTFYLLDTLTGSYYQYVVPYTINTQDLFAFTANLEAEGRIQTENKDVLINDEFSKVGLAKSEIQPFERKRLISGWIPSTH